MKTEYLIIGNGKLAKHLHYYFKLLGINYISWHRNSDINLDKLVKQVPKILLPISDDAIVNFITENKLNFTDKTLIHFSGSLYTQLAFGAHPLMTFSDKLYSLDFYKKIPFVIEKNRLKFSELFPSLPNSSYEIDVDKKSLYHAWCTISGNFTSILWKNFFDRLEDEFNINKKAAFPYMKAIFNNLKKLENPVTGPFVRNDSVTIQKHLNSLKQDPFKEVYNSFLDLYKKLNSNSGELK